MRGEPAYRVPAIASEACAVLTNTLPVSNYRAPGGAPSAYICERLVDMAARKIGMDPAEIRRRRPRHQRGHSHRSHENHQAREA